MYDEYNLISELPVVDKRWLLTSYKARKCVSLKPYLICDSVAPIEDTHDNNDEMIATQPALMDTSGTLGFLLFCLENAVAILRMIS